MALFPAMFTHATGPNTMPQGPTNTLAALGSLPLFNPGPAAAGGVDLLVQAGTGLVDKDAQSKLPPTRALVSAPAAQPGPFNLAATPSTKVVKRILDLEFVEMSEVTVDADLPQGPDPPPAPAHLPVTDISQWLERFPLVHQPVLVRCPQPPPGTWSIGAPGRCH